ncbi:4-hydroxybenzoate 3-monooxygenase [Corynebacterium ammoniagenes]|uniref:4-hydroxybenzoate 3-monooxygenase n=1 Tax=Corynebacterium ammoniagenes TaxID=1697 RepID=A0AAV5G7S8_CORAM|nr:4-hydroxybenzoate 3-monooxygenase [Corynebacterium ammoniagenes]GJN42340.1 4-hydroxybenzoate 3-monooxygenase [Corynebacterium ammoniagenes]
MGTPTNSDSSHTPVAIIGAGPAGLMLSHLLHLEGVESVVIEKQSREEVESTVRAGILEQGTIDLLRKTGVGDRLDREAEIDEGISISIAGESHRIDFAKYTGKQVAVYPQHEVLIDLIAKRLSDDGELWFDTEVVSIADHESDNPKVHYHTADGTEGVLSADFVVGADGSKSLARKLITDDGGLRMKHEYPFAWFGIMVNAPQTAPELIYATHPEGFALISTRSENVQRYYLQCNPDDTPDMWSDDRIWEQLHLRADSDTVTVSEGEITDKAVLRFRSAVTDPMQRGRLFIAGDAAHTVPPTGAKGLNLAMADVCALAPSLVRAVKKSDTSLLDTYSERALPRVWKTQHFSYWMSSMLHSVPAENEMSTLFQTNRRLAELSTVVTSDAGRQLLAQQYVGWDFPSIEAL